ncbi:MAG: DUF5131 family protein [Deltaproteobacteria bacterium]|nr:DUF5131 family protein [Deltaproteobacteria bacterium]
MNKTGIEYLDYTWNPIAMRCKPVSEGCANCWHMRTADRLKNNKKLNWRTRLAYGGEGDPIIVKSRLEEPSHRKKPSIIGVQFMGDLFHESVDDHSLLRIWSQMCVCGSFPKSPKHTFLVLTKRPKRMEDWVFAFFADENNTPRPVPSHIWIGVTVENQEQADKRIPVLLNIPAAVRFVSIEPMLSEIDLTRIESKRHDGCVSLWNVLRKNISPNIDWVIAGCESGGNRRPSKIEWFRNLRDQCTNAGVPFFLKQMEINGKVVSMPELDGEIWRQWPEALKK